MGFFDLNVPLPAPCFIGGAQAGPSGAKHGGNGQQQMSKKDKKKAKQMQQTQQAQQQTAATTSDVKGKGKELSPLERLTAAEKESLEGKVKDLRQLGYSTIAYNHVVHDLVEANVHRNPFYSQPSTSSSSSADHSGIVPEHMPHVSSPALPALSPSSSSSSSSSRGGVTQLNRLTVVLDDTSKHNSAGFHSLWPTLLSYDLLAIRPLTSNQFNAACLNYTEPKQGGQSFDIISLDLSSSARLPFYLKRTTVGKALDNGAVFEVCYSDAIEPSTSDASSSSSSRPPLRREERLRNLISNTRDLLRVTSGGRGVILSSGAAQVLGLRSPSDVINLATVLGFSPNRAREALSSACQSLLIRAQTRRSFRGVVGWPHVTVSTVTNGEQRDQGQVEALNSTGGAPDPERDMQLYASNGADDQRRGVDLADGARKRKAAGADDGDDSAKAGSAAPVVSVAGTIDSAAAKSGPQRKVPVDPRSERRAVDGSKKQRTR
ncbi:unnamed protein product [Jaminaea pallidilutea]